MWFFDHLILSWIWFWLKIRQVYAYVLNLSRIPIHPSIPGYRRGHGLINYIRHQSKCRHLKIDL
jgi:hypothetical protein